MHVHLIRPHGLLLVELALELFRSKPSCWIAVRKSGVDALLIVRVRSVSKVEKESRNLALLGRRKGHKAVLDFFDAHGAQNTAVSIQGKRAKSPNDSSSETAEGLRSVARWLRGGGKAAVILSSEFQVQLRAAALRCPDARRSS